MQNNIVVKITLTISFLILVGSMIVIYLGPNFFLARDETTNPDSSPDTVTVEKAEFMGTDQPENFGQSISPDEAGFGRENPFSTYK